VSPDADGDDDRPQASARTGDATPARSASESATSTSDRSRGLDNAQSPHPDGEQVRRPSEGGGASVEADGFGVKGWALTAVLFVSVIVIPGIIYVYPYAAGGLGFATYLALPLVPAALLGLVAVWSMTAAVADD